jgi:aspartyl-tRNA(Asn)/glutamyl-tRNA(Gln) amidotransferase subunit A
VTDLAFLSIPELGRLLRSRKLSAVDLAEHFLDRLERLGPTYNAVVTVLRESALAEARQRDRELATGKDRGPLHGIPYGAKDLLAAEGAPTTWGAQPYRQQMLRGDATVIVRLRAAGAVLCAKLAMVELAGGMGYNQAFASFTGPGKSPWDPTRWSAAPPAAPAPRWAPGWWRSRSGRTWGDQFPPPSVG